MRHGPCQQILLSPSRGIRVECRVSIRIYRAMSSRYLNSKNAFLVFQTYHRCHAGLKLLNVIFKSKTIIDRYLGLNELQFALHLDAYTMMNPQWFTC